MIIDLVPIRNNNLKGLRGLNDPFDSTKSYMATNNILDMAADQSVQERVIRIVNSGIVGQFNNQPVYNEAATGQVWVNVALSYPRLQELVIAAQTSAPPITGSDCPCNNCREEEVVETWYASKSQMSASDIPVKMTSEVVICEPTDSSAAPRVLCPDDAARLGVNGLGSLAMAFTDRQKKCMDKCRNVPADQFSSCLNRCNTSIQPSYYGISDTRLNSNTQYQVVDSGSQTQALPKMKFSFPTQFSLPSQPVIDSGARTADSAWGKCVTGCNSQRLSQNDLQKCYAACGTGTKHPGVFGQYAVAPTGQLVPLSGLSNDAGAPTTDTSGYVYDPALTYPIPPTMNCEQGNSNTLLLILTGVAGLAIGWLATTAWKKR